VLFAKSPAGRLAEAAVTVELVDSLYLDVLESSKSAYSVHSGRCIDHHDRLAHANSPKKFRVPLALVSALPAKELLREVQLSTGALGKWSRVAVE
jgi:hypothetical protein